MAAKPVETHLPRLALERVQRHLLPATTRVPLWAGPGSGGACSLCGELLSPIEIEYEVEDGSRENRRTFRLHIPCHAAWEEALREHSADVIDCRQLP
jgi:hypothetical protein